MLQGIRNQKGFTLIELLIVVVVIGILTSLAIPRYMGSTMRAKQTEAQGILKQVFQMQRAYKQEFEHYWGNGTSADAANPLNFARLGVEIGKSSRYTYAITANQTTFTVSATVPNPGLDDDPAPDIWTIDQNGDLRPTSNDLTQ